jgi:hypothetical protein
MSILEHGVYNVLNYYLDRIVPRTGGTDQAAARHG